MGFQIQFFEEYSVTEGTIIEDSVQFMWIIQSCEVWEKYNSL